MKKILSIALIGCLASVGWAEEKDFKSIFNGKNPTRYHHVGFKNGNSKDVRAENLYWFKRELCPEEEEKEKQNKFVHKGFLRSQGESKLRRM